MGLQVESNKKIRKIRKNCAPIYDKIIIQFGRIS